MPACRPPRGDDRRDDEERQRGDAGRDQRDLGGTRLRVADGPVVISLPIDPLWRALTWRHNVLAESFGPTAVWFREAAFIRRKRPPLRLSLPISFGGFLPELLGQPRCDQRYSARRPVPGSGVHLFEQPVIKLKCDLHSDTAIVGPAGARPSVAMHVRLYMLIQLRLPPRSLSSRDDENCCSMRARRI